MAAPHQIAPLRAHKKEPRACVRGGRLERGKRRDRRPIVPTDGGELTAKRSPAKKRPGRGASSGAKALRVSGNCARHRLNATDRRLSDARNLGSKRHRRPAGSDRQEVPAELPHTS